MSGNHWDGIDRRRQGACEAVEAPTEAMWNYLVSQLEDVNQKLSDIHSDNVNHKFETQAMKADIDSIKRAFPKADYGPDYDGHRDHHDNLIKTSKKWADIGNDVLKKVFSGTAWLVFVFICLAVYERIKQSINS